MKRTRIPGRVLRNLLFLVPVLLILVFCYAQYEQLKRSRIEAETLLGQIEITHQEIAVQRHRNSSLQDLLTERESENSALLESIASLKARPAEIRYVVRTETVVRPEPVYITPELPEEYLFRLENGLTVARFSSGSEYSFESFGLHIQNNIAVSDKKTAVLTKVRSDFSDAWYEMPAADIVSYRLPDEKQRVVKANLALGVAVNDQAQWEPVVALTWLTWKQFNFLTPRVGLRGPTMGVQPVGYNVGAPLPLIDDLWLAPAVSLDKQMQPVYSLDLVTRL